MLFSWKLHLSVNILTLTAFILCVSTSFTHKTFVCSGYMKTEVSDIGAEDYTDIFRGRFLIVWSILWGVLYPIGIWYRCKYGDSYRYNFKNYILDHKEEENNLNAPLLEMEEAHENV